MRLLLSLLLLTATCANAAPRPELALQIAGAGTVIRAVLSPSGQTIATNSEGDGAIKLWDTRTGEIRLDLRGAGNSDLAFARDGRTLLESGYQTLKVWDALNGKLLHEWKIDSGLLSPDATRLATLSGDGRTSWVEIWDARSGTRQQTLEFALSNADDADNGALTAVDWSPNGKQIAAAQRGGKLTLWNAQSGARVRTIDFNSRPIEFSEKPPEPMWINAIAFAPDGQSVAVASRGEPTRVAQTQTGRITRKLQLGKNASFSFYTALLWTQHDVLLEANEGAAVRVWDVKNGRSGGQLANTRNARALSLSRDGQNLLIGGVSPGLSLWDARTLKPKQRLAQDVRWPLALRGVAASPSARYLALAPYHGAGALWDWQSLTRRALPTGASLFLPDASLLVGAQDNSLEWRRVPNGELWKKQTLKARIEVIAAAPDGQTLAVVTREQVLLMNARSGQIERELPPRDGVSRAVAFSPDGNWLAAGGGDEQGWGEERGTVTLWNLRLKGAPRVLAAHNGVQSLAWSGNSHALAVGCGNIEGNDQWGEIQLFDAASGRLHGYLLGHAQPVQSLSWDGDTLLAASNADVKLWRVPADLKSAAQNQPIWTHDTGAMSVTASADGANFVVVQQDGTIEIRHRADHGLLATLLDLPTTGEQFSGFLRNWILWTPEGYYTGSSGCEKWIRWRVDGKLYPASRFAAQFRRPDLMRAHWRSLKLFQPFAPHFSQCFDQHFDCPQQLCVVDRARADRQTFQFA